MPRLNGLDLVKLLEKEGYRIPVIIMTGDSSIETLRNRLNAAKAAAPET